KHRATTPPLRSCQPPSSSRKEALSQNRWLSDRKAMRLACHKAIWWSSVAHVALDVADDLRLALALDGGIDGAIEQRHGIADVAAHQQQLVHHEELQGDKADPQAPLEGRTAQLGTEKGHVAVIRLDLLEDRQGQVGRLVLTILLQHTQLPDRHQPRLVAD